MGSSSSVPKDSPLGCLLTHWNQFKLQVLRKKKMIFFCNTEWPQYSLGDGEKWPINGTLNFRSIYQLDLFCRKKGKWTEVPYVQACMAINQDPNLRASCRMCLTLSQVSGPLPAQDILDDDCLNRLIPLNKPGMLGELPDSPKEEDTGSDTIPPPYKPQEPSDPSPAGHTRSGTPYLLGAPSKYGMHPLREVANGEAGTIRVHVPFSMADLAQVKQRLGRYSENPSQFIDGFQEISVMFDLTWKDVYIILSRCCTPEEKRRIWEGAQEFAGELAIRDRNHYLVGGTAVPNTEPHWNYQEDSSGREKRDHMITCLIEGMKKGFSKPVNFDKLQEVTQGIDENPALFQG
ncbi:uncharacterized protein LOC125080702 [Lutra lutra]|uniref:uncharacterized protein LOC125080702 n=1 Tax=Lutra lutra TaxID=9657 RepID=UPI001FD5D7AB|nr:uncharacterized protein LOC125080702 [Lutra lutra]